MRKHSSLLLLFLVLIATYTTFLIGYHFGKTTRVAETSPPSLKPDPVIDRSAGDSGVYVPHDMTRGSHGGTRDVANDNMKFDLETGERKRERRTTLLATVPPQERVRTSNVMDRVGQSSSGSARGTKAIQTPTLQHDSIDTHPGRTKNPARSAIGRLEGLGSALRVPTTLRVGVTRPFPLADTSPVQRNHHVMSVLRSVKKRDDMGKALQALNITSGIELGVQEGKYAYTVLSQWPLCTSYTLVDIWKRQERYRDIANVNNDKQELLLRSTRKRLNKWIKNRVITILRMRTNQAVHQIQDDSTGFVYLDARHDYCGVIEDLELYWPKVKPGGIMAGHDYLTADDVDKMSRGKQDWSLCHNGTRNRGAVKGAVLAWTQEHNLTVVVTKERWPTWIVYKPVSPI